MQYTRRYERIGTRHRIQFLWGVTFLFSGLIIFAFTQFFVSFPVHDFGVVESGSPMTVYWFKYPGPKLTLIRIAEHAASPVDPNYEQYSFSALSKLSTQTSGNEMILNKILSQTFRVPLLWNYANMGVSLRVYVWWHRLNVSQTQKTYIDLTKANFYRQKLLPNGDRISEIEISQIAKSLENVFENESIRNERLRVSVVNATTISGFGDKFSNVLGNMGVYVNAVSGKEGTLETCSLSGMETALQSRTAEVLRNFFGCQVIQIQKEGRSDLEITIGSKVFPY